MDGVIVTLDFIKICPKCKIPSGNYHLMMAECDDCINTNSKQTKEIPEKYIEHALGILVLNPKWVHYQENLK